MNKRPLQASAHYCERNKSMVFGESANSRESARRLIKASLEKTRPGSLIYIFLRGIITFFLKLLPCVGVFQTRHYSNNSLGIFLTPSCNLKCFNCEVAAVLAPANDFMSVEQVEKVISEAIKLGYYWDRIVLTGGEPTLHPHFFEVIAVIKQYKDFNPECQILLETNGSGNKVQSVLNSLPDWIIVCNSHKKEEQRCQDFFAYNLAPCDSWEYILMPCFFKGCIRISNCYGLCATMHGYYPCSPCANVDRVFAFNIGIKRLDQVTERALREQMKILCKHCGLFRELIKKPAFTPKISRSWKMALAKYRQQKPNLTRCN